MHGLGAIILCGGQSRRMGEPKLSLPIGDETMLGRTTRVVGEVAHPIVVVSRMDQPLPPLPEGVEIAHDAEEGLGPIAGLASGFARLAGRCEAVVAVSCDHPLLRSELLRKLAELLGEAPAIAPIHEGRSYPLLALYRAEVGAYVEAMLAEHDLRAQNLLERVQARLISSDLLRDVDPDLDSLFNVNDQVSYEQALRMLRARGEME